MSVHLLDNVVIKPPTDWRSYRILHLPNGLTAVLVHDPDIFPEGAESEADVRISKVEKGNPVSMVTGSDMSIWKPGKLYRLEDVKDVHVLDLSWMLPCLHKEYLKKPEDYLAHLLGHEGRGSTYFFFP